MDINYNAVEMSEKDFKIIMQLEKAAAKKDWFSVSIMIARLKEAGYDIEITTEKKEQ